MLKIQRWKMASIVYGEMCRDIDMEDIAHEVGLPYNTVRKALQYYNKGMVGYVLDDYQSACVSQANDRNIGFVEFTEKIIGWLDKVVLLTKEHTSGEVPVSDDVSVSDYVSTPVSDDVTETRIIHRRGSAPKRRWTFWEWAYLYYAYFHTTKYVTYEHVAEQLDRTTGAIQKAVIRLGNHFVGIPSNIVYTTGAIHAEVGRLLTYDDLSEYLHDAKFGKYRAAAVKTKVPAVSSDKDFGVHSLAFRVAMPKSSPSSWNFIAHHNLDVIKGKIAQMEAGTVQYEYIYYAGFEAECETVHKITLLKE